MLPLSVEPKCGGGLLLLRHVTSLSRRDVVYFHSGAHTKYALWIGSYVGLMGIDKRSGSATDRFNQSSGADTRLVFFQNLVVNGFASQTRTPGVSSGQTDLGGGFSYETSWFESF